MFKTETHLHTAETSPCGKVSAAEMVKRYHDAGYKTLFISDHFFTKYFDALGNLSPEEKVEQFLLGYEEAKVAGEELGMNILLSAELRLDGSNNDYLLYGVDKQFLTNALKMLDLSIEEFYRYAKEHGVTVIQAHPLRDGRCTPTPEFVDGLEAHNGNPRHENYTDKVMELAKKYNKLVTGGSDAHRPEDVGSSGILTEKEIRTDKDYIDILLEGSFTIIKGEEGR